MPGIVTQNFQYIAVILQTISIAMGLSMLFAGIFQLKKYGEMRTMMSAQMSIAGPLLLLLGGTVLLILPTFIGTMLLSFWGSTSILQYSGDASGIDAFLPPIILFVRIIGIGSLIRGVHLLSRSGGHHAQPGTVGKGLIHMLAGILCINILETVNLLAELLGFSPIF